LKPTSLPPINWHPPTPSTYFFTKKARFHSIQKRWGKKLLQVISCTRGNLRLKCTLCPSDQQGRHGRKRMIALKSLCWIGVPPKDRLEHPVLFGGGPKCLSVLQRKSANARHPNNLWVGDVDDLVSFDWLDVAGLSPSC